MREDSHGCSSKSKGCTADEREWEEMVCPICMEHPHNGVLLICTSHDKGCRPFICDTSPLLSNCLDRLMAAANIVDMDMDMMMVKEVSCPFCRGKIRGLDRGHPAREFMNSLSRSCAVETCSFRGNFADLQRHVQQQKRRVVGEEPFFRHLPRLVGMHQYRLRPNFPRLNQPDQI